MIRLDPFTRAYIEAMLWSTTDESTPQGGEPLDANYDETDLSVDTLAQIVEDCRAFQRDNAVDIAAGDDPQTTNYTADKRAGHDFWLTRERHGAGFWDGDWTEPAASRLTDAAHAYGSFELYVGDDGLIHH